jgi:flagella synthesis protein FlgN
MHRSEELIDTIRRQTSAFTELDAVLVAEYQALTSGDHAALNDCSTRRGPLLASIEALDRRMAECLGVLRIDSTREGIERLFAELPPIPRRRALAEFAELREIAQRCRERNEINGKVILQSQWNAERLLRILRGNVAAPAETYSSSGQVDPQAPSTTLVTV